MTFILFLVLVIELVLELVLDNGSTVTLVVVDELLKLYIVLQADLLDNLIDESMGTDCDLLLLFFLRIVFPFI